MAKKLSGRQKAAIALISLGPDASSEVLKQFKETEIERMTKEIFSVEKVSEELKDEVLGEMFDMALSRNFLTSGGADYARTLLDKTLGESKADELIGRRTALKANQRFEFLKDIESTQLLSYIQGEHPQTIALIISYLPTVVGASVLASLAPELRRDVAMRIAIMDRTPPEVVDQVEKMLRARLSSVIAQDLATTGGVDALVKILNSVDRSTERGILDHLAEVDEELASEVRKKMFSFDDLILLDDRALQRILREIDSKDLVLALKGANDELTKAIYRNQSTRAAQMLKEELEVLGPVRLRSIEEAQQRIANVVRKLEESEEIVLARGDEDLVV